MDLNSWKPVIVQLRLGILPLYIQTWWFIRMPAEERICKLGNQYNVGQKTPFKPFYKLHC